MGYADGANACGVRGSNSSGWAGYFDGDVYVDGDVGIGTTSPGRDLEVNGTLQADDYYSGDGTQGSTATKAGLTFKDGLYTGGAFTGLADHAASQNIECSGYWLSNDGDNEGIYVSSNGNVGIGSSEPSTLLDISGTADMTTLSIGGTSVTATAAELNYVDGVTSAIQTQLDAKVDYSSTTASYIPKMSDSATVTDSAIYDSSGNIGIGTTTPDRTLTVDGEIQIQASGTDKWHLSTTGSGDLYFTETGVDTRIKFLSGGTVMPNSSKSQDLGSDSWPWDDVYADDYTTKCDWVDPQETDVVSAVMNIDFEMITKGDGTEIAHLDHATMPEFVRVREKLRHPDGTWKGAYWKDGQKVTLGSYEMDGEVFYPENDRPVNAQAVPAGAEWIGEYTGDYEEAYSINKMQVFLIEMVKEQQLLIEEQRAEIDSLKAYLGME